MSTGNWEPPRSRQPAGSGFDNPIIDHVQRFIGPVDAVLRRPPSDEPRIDLAWVGPGPKRDHHTLVTLGMSDKPMTRPDEGCSCHPYVELVLRLPAPWPLRPPAPLDEKASWPLDELEHLASMPHREQSVLGFGHTVSAFDPATQRFGSVDPGGRFAGWILRRPDWAPPRFRYLRKSFDRQVAFLSIVAVHLDELRLAYEEGSERLLDRLDAAGVTDLLALDRPSVLAPFH